MKKRFKGIYLILFIACLFFSSAAALADISLNFDTLPSAQGWEYSYGSYWGATCSPEGVLPVGVLMQKKLSGGALARWSDGHVTIRIRPAVIVPAHPEILNRLPSLVRL